MAVTKCSSGYYTKCIKYQTILYSPLKEEGFVPENGSEVFVRKIPVEENEYDLVRFFEKIGKIFQVRLMMSENRKENRGFAYVTYVNSTLAKKAVATLNNLLYKGKYYLRIEQSLDNCRLFIGGIPTQKTKDQIWQELYKNAGVTNIIDVIMYRSYTDRAENRGFVFVEFKTHEDAAYFRAKYGKTLRLWDQAVIVDWSVPILPADASTMKTVKILYLRNLEVSEPPDVFQKTIEQFVSRRHIEKVYKFKNYAFVHLETREIAENLIPVLQDYYKGTPVEVVWAKPPNKFTNQEYRQKRVSSLSVRYPPKFNQSRMESIEQCSAKKRRPREFFNVFKNDKEEAWDIWQQASWISGMNVKSIVNFCDSKSTTLTESSSISSETEHSLTSQDCNSTREFMQMLTTEILHQTASVDEIDVATLPHSWPPLPEVDVDQERTSCQNEFSAYYSSSSTAEPSCSDICEGVDPIKVYQRQMAKHYGPKTLLFDKDNIKEEMDFMPRGYAAEDIAHYIGNLLDDSDDEI